MQTKALETYLVSQYRSLTGVCGQLGINPKLIQDAEFDIHAVGKIARLLGLSPEQFADRVAVYNVVEPVRAPKTAPVTAPAKPPAE